MQMQAANADMHKPVYVCMQCTTIDVCNQAQRCHLLKYVNKVITRLGVVFRRGCLCFWTRAQILAARMWCTTAWRPGIWVGWKSCNLKVKAGEGEIKIQISCDKTLCLITMILTSSCACTAPCSVSVCCIWLGAMAPCSVLASCDSPSLSHQAAALASHTLTHHGSHLQRSRKQNLTERTRMAIRIYFAKAIFPSL